jgi:hypothetical protein
VQAEKDRLAAENKTLQAIQNENKALQAKLSAARSQNESLAIAKATAGGNSKATAQISGTEAARMMKMKEELYGDLTGLMIHTVKRVEGEDVFDCIQTGRNGSEFYTFN